MMKSARTPLWESMADLARQGSIRIPPDMRNYRTDGGDDNSNDDV
jgi:hypothetical protein